MNIIILPTVISPLRKLSRSLVLFSNVHEVDTRGVIEMGGRETECWKTFFKGIIVTIVILVCYTFSRRLRESFIVDVVVKWILFSFLSWRKETRLKCGPNIVSNFSFTIHFRSEQIHQVDSWYLRQPKIEDILRNHLSTALENEYLHHVIYNEPRMLKSAFFENWLKNWMEFFETLNFRFISSLSKFL